MLAAGEYTVPGAAAAKKTTVDDTFLFGSGTKPFTSSAVLGLVAKGLVTLDDPVSEHVDRCLGKLKPGTTMVGLFGPEAARITVGHVLRMQSGVPDFDQPGFDAYLLRANESYLEHSPLDFIEAAASQPAKMQFEPGTQVSYSSTNYQLAGLVLLAHSNATAWSDMDMAAFFPDAVLGKLRFFRAEMIDELLTVPGTTGGGYAHLPTTIIYNQSSTILGWTCGNMVGTAGDVARFLWDLLGPEPRVVPPQQLAQMEEFKPLSFGWAKGYISYGAGLMVETATSTASLPPVFDEVGTYMGHGGDTYGFLSEQGVIYGLNASMSVIANQDGEPSFVQSEFMCSMIETAYRVLTGASKNLRCRG